MAFQPSPGVTSPTMKHMAQVGVAAISVLLLTLGAILHVSCTKGQRQIVRTVVDLVDQVCGDRDSVDECLGKAQAARAAARAAQAGPDAGAPVDAGPVDASAD